ncbi:hypothetical protein Avbf_12081, partial [Armadillidium vulgare]
MKIIKLLGQNGLYINIHGAEEGFLHVTRNKLHHHILIWSSDVALKYLQKAGKLKLFNSRHYWLIILTSNFTFEEVQKQVKDVTFYIDSEMRYVIFH